MCAEVNACYNSFNRRGLRQLRIDNCLDHILIKVFSQLLEHCPGDIEAILDHRVTEVVESSPLMLLCEFELSCFQQK